MLTDEQKRILISVFSRKQENCPYCQLPLYLSDANIESNDGTLVDIWECMRDNKTFTVPSNCSVDVLKRLHITVEAKTIGCYGDNEIGEYCNTFQLMGDQYTFCQLCCKKIKGGWEIGDMRVCSNHTDVTYERQ